MRQNSPDLSEHTDWQLQMQTEFKNVLGRSLAEGARAALYHAASTGRVTEPRLAGGRGSRPSRVTIAPPDYAVDVNIGSVTHRVTE